MGGTITATQISGSLDAKNIVMDVLNQMNAYSNLNAIFQKVPVPELTGTVPVSKPGTVDEDVGEGESTDINGGDFAYVSFDLKKDRKKLARTDESLYKSKVGDPLGPQKIQAATELAQTLDKKIITALESSPQTGACSGVWSTVTNSPLKDIATAVKAILPYRADCVIMPGDVHAAYLATNAIASLSTGNPAAFTGAVGMIPGWNIPIYVDDNATAKTAIVASASGYGALIGNGPVNVRDWDEGGSGMHIYQIDLWRQVKSGIFKTSASLNKTAYVLTAAIA
jgi:hypothetical protein